MRRAVWGEAMKVALWVIISVVGYIIASSVKDDWTRFSSKCRKTLAAEICWKYWGWTALSKYPTRSQLICKAVRVCGIEWVDRCVANEFKTMKWAYECWWEKLANFQGRVSPACVNRRSTTQRNDKGTSDLNWEGVSVNLLTREQVLAVGTGVSPHTNQLRFDPADQFALLFRICNRDSSL